jgi:hypothetical protein
VVPGNGEEVWGKYIWTKGRVEEDKGSKETDGCPLTVWNVAGEFNRPKNITFGLKATSICFESSFPLVTFFIIIESPT